MPDDGASIEQMEQTAAPGVPVKSSSLATEYHGPIYLLVKLPR